MNDRVSISQLFTVSLHLLLITPPGVSGKKPLYAYDNVNSLTCKVICLNYGQQTCLGYWVFT